MALIQVLNSQSLDFYFSERGRGMVDKDENDELQFEMLLRYTNSIIATLREPFLVLDENLRIIFTNQSFCTIFKVAEKDTIGQLLPDFCNHQWDIPILLLLLKEILQNNKVVRDFEVKHAFEHIGERSMLLNACQVRVPKKVARMIGAEVKKEEENLILLAIEDVTGRKKVEENIKEITMGLEKTVSRRTMELSAALKEMEEYSYSIAHDLKAPLRAMAGFANILSEDYAPQLDDNAKRVIGVIKDNARNMGQLIDDLLKLSFLLRKEMVVVDIDMTMLAKSVYDELRESFPRDKIIEVSVKPMSSAHADPTLARQIVTNLISNAIKFTSRKDKAIIEIGGYDQGEKRIYYVKDNGVGFDMKYVNNLFGVFHRLHAQDEFSGTGIGLAIVSNAVRRHGGTVWVEGEVDKGATFYFTLPKGGAQ